MAARTMNVPNKNSSYEVAILTVTVLSSEDSIQCQKKQRSHHSTYASFHVVAAAESEAGSAGDCPPAHRR